MKTFRLFFAMLALTVSTVAFAQTKTEVIKVSGLCTNCKARIEKAAKIPGVSTAVWNVKTKKLTVVYDASKTKLDSVEKHIAEAGHDTPEYKASNKAYNALPSCCKYRPKSPSMKMKKQNSDMKNMKM